MKRRTLLAGTGLLLLIAAAGAGVLVRGELAARVQTGTDEQPVFFDVAPGESPAQIAARLEKAGIVRSARVLLALGRWRGADRAFRYGRHEFKGALTAGDVLTELSRVPKPLLRVTIPEGLTWREIGVLLENAGAARAADYQAVVCSDEFKRAAGAQEAANCAEGFLFPDTYDLMPGMTARQIADLQLRRFREVAAPLAAALGPVQDRSPAATSAATPPKPSEPLPDAALPAAPAARAASPATPAGQPGASSQNGLPSGASPTAATGTHRESQTRLARMLTIASIIEKETAVVAERPLVAAVIYNRLRLGMPLQVDPTVIYGVIASGRSWNGNLTRTDLEARTPYNTYTQRELPPGPICNPGLASLRAALAPADAPFLYFVARGTDGSHEFSSTLTDHNRAVRRYQIR